MPFNSLTVPARAALAALVLVAGVLGAAPRAAAQAPDGQQPRAGTLTDETPAAAQPLIGGPVEGAAGLAGRELVVATKPAPPFAFRGPDGEWTGISIELWARLADELDLAYRFEETTLEGLVEGTAAGAYDAAVAALTITAPREALVDFTYPFYSTGLGIATGSGSAGGWLRVARNFLSWEFLTVIGALSAVLLAAGGALWVFERGRNDDQFDRRPAPGLGSGFWWAAVTMTTVGYGDKAPVTLGGRIVALIWMFASMIIVASFTAAIAASLTVGQLGGSVQGISDLHDVRVGVVQGSAGAGELAQRQILARGYPGVEEGLRAVAEGEIEAFVHDRPLLRYAVRRQFQGEVEVLAETIGRQDYGIALPEDAALAEPLDRALLALTRSPAWETIVSRYLGRED